MYPKDVHDNLLSQDQRNILKVGALFCYDLGKPVVADVDRYVENTDMKVGAYTIAAQPDIPRNVTVTRTETTALDTGGTIVITGTNILDEVITETITVGATTVTVAGTKAFKAITEIKGVGWEVATAADKITVGCGNELGLPFALSNALDAPFGVLGGTMLACATTVTDPPTVEGTTIDMNAGTYDGVKEAQVLARYSA